MPSNLAVHPKYMINTSMHCCNTLGKKKKTGIVTQWWKRAASRSCLGHTTTNPESWASVISLPVNLLGTLLTQSGRPHHPVEMLSSRQDFISTLLQQEAIYAWHPRLFITQQKQLRRKQAFSYRNCKQDIKTGMNMFRLTLKRKKAMTQDSLTRNLHVKNKKLTSDA